MQKTQLRTTQLGETGLEITRVGFGAWAIGGDGYQFGWGINWIDTAAVYGLGRSERVVAKVTREWLASLPGDRRLPSARPGRSDPRRTEPGAQRRGCGRDRGPDVTTVGFVGLGAMGGRMAGRLLASGHQVYGTNRSAVKGVPLVERGLVWRDTPRAVAEAADVIFSMVTDDAALEAVASGPDGILTGLAPGKFYVDMSTVSPHVSRELAERVRALGAEMLDAPVSGSLPAAEDGSLTIMVGGGEGAFAQIEPVLHELGAMVTRIGENGHGLLMKLAVNISLAEQMLAFSEGVLLAEKGGIDPALAVDVLTQSAVGSPMLKSRGPFVLDLPEQALFDVSLMRKDLHLALEAAGTLDVPLPTAAVAKQLFTAAGAMGYEHEDMAVVYEVLAEMGGQ